MNDENETIIDPALVKNCWSKITSAKGSDFFIDNFYQNMFNNHPTVRAFFPKELDLQKIKLLSTLDNIINGIEYVDDLKEELTVLGKQHKALGIKAEMYEQFISTIVIAANASSNFSLTTKELLSWKNAFRKISNVMLEAYK